MLQAVLAIVLIIAVIIGAVLLFGPGLVESWNARPDPRAQRIQAEADLERARGAAEAEITRAGAEASATRAEATATRLYAALPWLVIVAVIALAVAGGVMGIGLLRERRDTPTPEVIAAQLALARMQGYLAAQNQMAGWIQAADTALIVPTAKEVWRGEQDHQS